MTRHAEFQIHKSIVQWLKAAAPDLIINHSPLGELSTARAVAKARVMGARPGWPDIEIIDGGTVHFLEVKRPGGRLSDEQIGFRFECIRRGINYAVVHSIDEARQALSMWKIQTREAA